MIKSQYEFIKCGKNQKLYVTSMIMLSEFYQFFTGERS